MSEASIDGELLDDLEEILRERSGPDSAITSGALSDRLDRTDDGDANPKTREAIRILSEERGVPIAATNRGYYLLQTTEQLESYLSDLDSRISGIQQRKQIVVSAWNDSAEFAEGGDA